MTNKSIHDLIKGSALSSFKLQESATMKLAQEVSQGSHLASLVFKESAAMKSMREMTISSQLATSIFQESAAMKSTQEMTRANQLATSIFQESATMKSIREMTRASQLATSMFQESSAMKSMREMVQGSQLASLVFKESTVMKSIREMTQASQLATSIFQESATMKSIREMIDSQSFADLARLSSLKAAAQLENSPFSNGVLSACRATVANVENIDATILEIDSELSEEVSSATDYNQLSEKSKSILSYIYHTYILPMLYMALGLYITAVYGEELRRALETVSSTSEVHTFVRKAKIKFDRDALAGFRVTTANSLKLRKSPSMSAETINYLPLGTLVEVVEKPNRSWLFVEVEVDGEFIQGWVSRRYTVYFK